MKKMRLLGIVFLALAACSGNVPEEQPREQRRERSSEHNNHAPFAMSYQPTSEEALLGKAQAVVRRSPEDALAYRDLANAFLQRKRETAAPRYFALAKDAIHAAQKLAPTSSTIRTSAVQILLSDHQFSEAIVETRKLISADPSNATAYLLLSDALVEEGQYKEAAEALQDAMGIFPDLRVYARGSYLRWLAGDRDGAIEFILDAISFGSRSKEAMAWCYTELGMIHWHANQLEMAESAANASLSIVPQYVPAIELQARIASSRGDVGRAIALYTELKAARPTVASHVGLADAFKQGGYNQQALEQRLFAEDLADEDPLALALHNARHQVTPKRTLTLAKRAFDERSNVYTRATYALALLRAGNVQEAQELIQNETYGTIDASLWVYRGLIQLASGKRVHAQHSLSQALALNASVDPLLVSELQSKLTRKDSVQ
jgi:tetratricopeptide (TPR) repeat protein